MNIALASAFAALTLVSFHEPNGHEPNGHEHRGPAQVDAVELGTVDWLRDLDVALVQAKAKDKPVFALFQEVPG